MTMEVRRFTIDALKLYLGLATSTVCSSSVISSGGTCVGVRGTAAAVAKKHFSNMVATAASKL